jgi:hypothetical protein
LFLDIVINARKAAVTAVYEDLAREYRNAVAQIIRPSVRP